MLFKKLKYQFDNLMSKGTFVLVMLLFGVVMIIMLLTGSIAMLIDGKECSFFHSVWENFMYTLNAGHFSDADGNTAFLMVALLVTFCGLFFTSVLIGIITSGIVNKMSELQRGKSVVFESDHIVMLGFSETSILILKELVISGENQRRQVIVILDEKNKDDIETEIRRQIPNPNKTKFVCRSGKPDNIEDLKICSLERSRSIIIAGDDDYYSLKSVLAISKILNEFKDSNVHITTTVHEAKIMHAITLAGGKRIETIGMQRTITRIIAHSCLQPGISSVLTKLFNFEGDEIYVETISGAEGMRFDRANLRFQNSTLIGIVRNRKPLLNPAPGTLIETGDKLVLIAADDGESSFTACEARVDEINFAGDFTAIKQPKKLLVLGYSPMLMEILSEEDKYLTAGSQITIAFPPIFSSAHEQLGRLKLENIEIVIKSDEICDHRCLEELLNDEPENVLVLSNLLVSRNKSDTESMALLLLLRDIAQQKNLKFSITTEIQNVGNQQLISSEVSTDFVVSSYITAMITSQISQTRELSAIFEDLLDENGSEIYLKPAAKYIKLGLPVDFFTISASVARHNEVFIGYRKKAPSGQYKTIINPAKADRESFLQDDSFIVLAES